VKADFEICILLQQSPANKKRAVENLKETEASNKMQEARRK